MGDSVTCLLHHIIIVPQYHTTARESDLLVPRVAVWSDFLGETFRCSQRPQDGEPSYR